MRRIDKLVELLDREETHLNSKCHLCELAAMSVVEGACPVIASITAQAMEIKSKCSQTEKDAYNDILFMRLTQ